MGQEVVAPCWLRNSLSGYSAETALYVQTYHMRRPVELGLTCEVRGAYLPSLSG